MHTSEDAMTKTDLEAFHTTLTAMHRRLHGGVSSLASEQPNGGPAADPADLGADSYEQEFALNLLQNQEQVLGEIHDALERIKQGKFGRCEECGGAIPKARLQAVPYARHCVACARKLQQGS
jgi:RNA polymerase-binding protein DksA